MYLKSLTVTNFRKFENENNTVHFVASNDSEIEGSDSSSSNNVASATTLIVGKNNSGKTTVTKALDKLLNDSNKVVGNDFNFFYLNRLLKEYILSSEIKETPILLFKLSVCVDVSSEVLVTNVRDFMDIDSDSTGVKELTISIKYQIKEVEIFKEKLIKILDKKYPSKLLFNKFLELINNTDFKVIYYDLHGSEVKNKNFKISSLIEVKLISANKNLHATNLSSVFNRIIKNRYESDSALSELETLVEYIDNLNEKITDGISENHNGLVNDVLKQVESSDHLKVELSSDLTFDKLMTNLIKHEYSEFGLSIPENQFGLGYTNLMNILGEIIEYVEKYPLDSAQSKINLICIEEPETFMHPQMQESFIKFIDDAVKHLLGASVSKKLNSQLVITTHSSHILNSKIHSSNSFDNINYIALENGKSSIVRLNDTSVSGDDVFEEGGEETESDYNKRKSNELKFIKKHIKYKVSELFFSDAVIFVEGITEETLLNYYIDQNEDLNKYYISICNINGAHGLVYLPLIKLLKIPILIITDLDIKRSTAEKKALSQIISIKDKKTTNTTIHKFNSKNESIKDIVGYFTEGNLRGVFQKDQVEGYYATSFEEALILQNYDNEILNKVISKTKPKIYKEIVGKEVANQDRSQLKVSSFKLQKKLSDSKSDFANNMLYEFFVRDEGEELPVLPQYIQDGLFWLGFKVAESLSMGES